MGSFFERRADVVFDAIAGVLDEPPPHTVRIEAPPDVQLLIDGHVHNRRYVGRYFDEQVLSVQMTDGGPNARWRLGGAPIQGQSLNLRVEHDLDIRALNVGR